MQLDKMALSSYGALRPLAAFIWHWIRSHYANSLSLYPCDRVPIVNVAFWL